ncbi:MAG: ATP synthase subunit C [Methylococcales bacterium]|nr:ATP synthase subunit C [Methylococcales bacterium]
MNETVMFLGWVGLYAPVALGALGSSIGCSIAGQAAIGAMLDTESGYGRYVGVSAMPSSMVIFGIVIMMSLNRTITADVAPGIFVIGVLSGLVLLATAIYQGQCCACAILAAKSKPEIFGLSIVPAAIVEGFAVFAFIFALVVIGDIPKP